MKKCNQTMLTFTKRFLNITSILSIFLFSLIISCSNSSDNSITPVSEKKHDYLPGEIIIKYKPETAIQIKNALQNSINSKNINVTSSISSIDKKYNVSNVSQLFKSIDTDKGYKNNSTLSNEDWGKDANRNSEYISSQGLEDIFIVTTSKDTNIEDAILEVTKDPEVLYAEPNYIVSTQSIPNDPYYNSSNSWGQGYDDLWGLKKINAEQAWDISQGEGVVVAVVDSGIDYNHPDIAANVWTNPNEIPGNGIDDDGNGYIDDIRGWDFIGVTYATPKPDNDPKDGFGHGTHVAGTIAAVGNNNIGVIGVAPKARVMAVKGLDDKGYGVNSALAASLIYAADMGADVINNSWGGTGNSKVIEDAVNYAYSKGAVLVAAAGNNNTDISSFYPANMKNVITVASTDYNDSKSDFSNYGINIDISAPGGSSDNFGSNRIYEDILSLHANGTDMYQDGKNIVGLNYYRARGTSMASPHVAGAVALLLAKDNRLTAEDIRQILRVSADDVGVPGFDIYTGFGRINLLRALTIDSVSLARITSTSPKPNTILKLSDSIEIKGTASGGRFSFYQLEYTTSLDNNDWQPIASPVYMPVTDGILGKLTISRKGVYYIRLTVTGKSANGADMFYRDFAGPFYAYSNLHSGWPMTIKDDSSNFSDRIQYHPVLHDFEKDGKQEIVICSVNKIWILDSEGSVLPGWPQEGLGAYNSRGFLGAPAIGDIDNDGIDEIVVRGISGVRILRYNGTELISNSLSGEQASVYSASLADIDGDGQLEIIYFYHPKNNFYLSLLNVQKYAGNKIANLPGWPKTITDNDNIVYFVENDETISIGDVDNDGDLEIVCLMMSRINFVTTSKIFILNGKGEIKYNFNVMPDPVTADSGPLLVDLDLDGDLEIGVTYRGGNSDGYEHLTFMHHDGTVCTGWPYLYEGGQDYFNSITNPIAGDLDNDSIPEIVHWRWNASGLSMITAVDNYGKTKTGWPYNISTSPHSSAPALIGDVNGDMSPDIIFPTGPNSYGDSTKKVLFFLDRSSYEIDRIIFPGGNSSSGLSAAIGDIDNDGKVEIVTVNNDSGSGMVSVFDLDGAYNPSSMKWPTYRNNKGLTGCYNCPYPVTIIKNVNISVTALTPSVTSVPIGKNSIIKTVTVTNTGTTDITIGQIAQLDSLKPPFKISLDTCSSKPLLNLQNCTIKVQFRPTAIGSFTDSFDIPFNDHSVTVNVAGKGIGPKISISSAQIDLGTIDIKDLPSKNTFTISNIGDTSLILGQIGQMDSLNLPFKINLDNCSGKTLLNSESCTITVQFDPVAAGNFSDSFDIPSNDHSVTVNVAGKGINGDTDNDGILDTLEIMYFSNLATASSTSDYDHDGVLDYLEIKNGTNPIMNEKTCANLTISGTDLRLVGYISSGCNISYSATNTIITKEYFEISANASVLLKGNSVFLKPGFTAQRGSNLRIGQ